MVKYKKGSQIVRLLIVGTFLGLATYAGWRVWSQESLANKSKKSAINNSDHLFTNSADLTEGKRVSYTGKVESIDLSAMKVDRPGAIQVKPLHEDAVMVHVDAGESACDRKAIELPNLKIGDIVKVYGDRGSDGIVRICELNTYIKKA